MADTMGQRDTMVMTQTAAWSFDSGFVLFALLAELGLVMLQNTAVFAIISYFGYLLLLISLGYSVQFGVGTAKRGLLAQLGLGMNTFTELLMLFPMFMLFAVAMTLPAMCLNDVLLQLGYARGIDDLHPWSPLKMMLVVAMFGTVYISYNAEGLFRDWKRLPGDTGYFQRVLPTLCAIIGAAVNGWGESVVASMGGDGDGVFAASLYLYIPMRYLITRTVGATWRSLLVGALVFGLSVFLS